MITASVVVLVVIKRECAQYKSISRHGRCTIGYLLILDFAPIPSVGVDVTKWPELCRSARVWRECPSHELVRRCVGLCGLGTSVDVTRFSSDVSACVGLAKTTHKLHKAIFSAPSNS